MFQKAHAAAILPANMWKSAPRRPFRVKIRKFPHPPKHLFRLKSLSRLQKKTKFGPPYAAHSLFEPIFGSDIVTGVQAALPVAAKRGQPAGYTCFVVESIIYKTLNPKP